MRWGAGAAGCEPAYVGEWNCATEAHDRAEMSLAYANRKKANCTDHRSGITYVADETISPADR